MLRLCLVGLVALVGCSAPSLHGLTVRQWMPMAGNVLPTDDHRLWWKGIARCTGTDVHFDSLQFVSVPANSIQSENSRMSFGAWLAPYTIILVEAKLGNRDVVRHEMVHVATQSREHGRVFRDCEVPVSFAY